MVYNNKLSSIIIFVTIQKNIVLRKKIINNTLNVSLFAIQNGEHNYT